MKAFPANGGKRRRRKGKGGRGGGEGARIFELCSVVCLRDKNSIYRFSFLFGRDLRGGFYTCKDWGVGPHQKWGGGGAKRKGCTNERTQKFSPRIEINEISRMPLVLL